MLSAYREAVVEFSTVPEPFRLLRERFEQARGQKMRKYLNVHFIECFQLNEISFKNLQMQSLTFHLVRTAKFSY